jgi:hypothetical protein
MVTLTAPAAVNSPLQVQVNVIGQWRTLKTGTFIQTGCPAKMSLEPFDNRNLHTRIHGSGPGRRTPVPFWTNHTDGMLTDDGSWRRDT